MAKRTEAEAISEGRVAAETIPDRAKWFLSDVQGLAAEFIDASEEFAKKLLALQSRATSWAKDTPLAPVFKALNSVGQQLVELSTRTARALWRVSPMG